MDLSLPSARVIRMLERIMEKRGKPKAIRYANGPEYISDQIMEWVNKQGIELHNIQPGKPQ